MAELDRIAPCGVLISPQGQVDIEGVEFDPATEPAGCFGRDQTQRRTVS